MSGHARWMRQAGLVLLALLVLSGAGCLTFDRQTVVLVFPPASKEVRGLIVYEGLRVGGDKPADLTRAKEMLQDVMQDQKGFFLFSPMVQLALKPDREVVGEERALTDLLNKQLALGKGAFFEDRDGRLCGYQTITIRDRDKLMDGLNAALSASMQKWAEEELKKGKARTEKFDDETLRMVRRAGGMGYTWLRLEPGRLSFTMPATEAGVKVVKENFFSDMKEPVKEWLIDLPLSFDQRKGHFTASLGVGAGEPLVVRGPAEKGVAGRKIDADLLAHARTLKVPFRAGLTTEKLVKAFLESGVPEPK